MTTTKQWLTLAQAAKRKKVTTRTVFNWVKHGVLRGEMRRPEHVPKIMHVDAVEIVGQAVALDQDALGPLHSFHARIHVLAPPARAGDGQTFQRHVIAGDGYNGAMALPVQNGAINTLQRQRVVDDDWPRIGASRQQKHIAGL